MKLLEERIRKDGVVKPGNVLKVDSFLNHQMDVIFFNEMAKEFKRLYEGVPINKILTIEASGIGIAIMAGLHLGSAGGLCQKVTFQQYLRSGVSHGDSFLYA